MVQELPEWLDKPFLEAALYGGEERGCKIRVEDFSAVLAVTPGNNYTSQIFRVQVWYRTEGSSKQSTTMIIKALHVCFQKLYKEPIMYSRVLPKIKMKIKHDFAPAAYYSTQNHVLVLQDLKETGYTMCDKFQQLDYAHCEFVFRTMAKFHAASVDLHNENPEEIEKLGIENIFSEESTFLKMTKPLMGLSVRIITDILKKTENSEPIIQFLLGKQETFVESLVEICRPKKKGLNVMNHGDLWNNNMLFKYTDMGEVKDVKFIDYQAIRYMTPAVDILYFTFTSADEDVRENRLHQLYNVYLQTLNDFLEQLGCKERYTSEELWQDLRSSINFAIVTILVNLPMMLAEPEDAIDLSDFDINEFINKADNGVIDPKILTVHNGKQFTAEAPKIIRHVYKLLSESSF